jgi:hypothetical protein
MRTYPRGALDLQPAFLKKNKEESVGAVFAFCVLRGMADGGIAFFWPVL